MYVPTSFRSEDPDAAWQVVEREPFGLLLVPPTSTSSGAPEAGHALDVAPAPMLADRSRRVLRTHLAAANPASRGIDGREVTVIFQGPHAYVTPRWYEDPTRQVPTWNYVVARMAGRARTLPREETRALLAELCVRFEPEDGYRLDWLDPALGETLLSAIVGIEIDVTIAEAKLKLSQNRSRADRARAVQGLTERDAPGDAELLAWMKE